MLFYSFMNGFQILWGDIIQYFIIQDYVRVYPEVFPSSGSLLCIAHPLFLMFRNVFRPAVFTHRA